MASIIIIFLRICSKYQFFMLPFARRGTKVGCFEAYKLELLNLICTRERITLFNSMQCRNMKDTNFLKQEFWEMKNFKCTVGTSKTNQYLASLYQRWGNSVLKTKYEYEYYSAFWKWPNTNTNTNNIRSSKNAQIWIRKIFGLPKTTEYEYE